MCTAQAAFEAFAATVDEADTKLGDARTLLRMSESALAAGRVTAAEHEQCIMGIMRSQFLRDGASVLITGLTGRPELNGRRATICGELKDGRLPVEVPSEATGVRLRPLNMRPAPPALQATEYEPGSLVELGGLTSASASTYNGAVGEVMSSSDGDERVAVRLHLAADKSKSLLVKPANLRVASLERCLVWRR